MLKKVEYYSGKEDEWKFLGAWYYRYDVDHTCERNHNILKLVVSPEYHSKLVERFSNDYEGLPCENIFQYAEGYYEHDSENRITCERRNGNFIQITRHYTDYLPSQNMNCVVRRVSESFGDGRVVTRFSNSMGKTVLLEETSTSDKSFVTNRNYFVYDNAGNLIREYDSSSIQGYRLIESAGYKLIKAEIAQNEGKIITYEMASTSLDAKRKSISIQKGMSGTPEIVRRWKHVATYANHKRKDRISKAIEYPTETENRSNITMYDYELFPNSTRIKRRTTFLPVIPYTENGNHTTLTEIEFYDWNENVVWSKDAAGMITHQIFDSFGRLIKRIVDVDSRKTSDFGEAIPSGWSTATDAGKHLVSEYQYDHKGRLVRSLGPIGEGIGEDGNLVRSRTVSWTIYDDFNRLQRNATGYLALDASNNITHTVLYNPVTIVKRDVFGNVVEQIQATRQSTSGPLLGSDQFPQSSYIAWTKHIYRFNKRTASRQYFDIPSSGEGEKDVHYSETLYDYDARGRLNKSVSPIGTIQRTVFDDRGNTIQQWTGTNDAGATESDPKADDPANDMTLVSEAEYGGGSGSGCSSCGSNATNRLIAQIQHVDEQTSRVTEYHYDWRGRQIRTVNEEDAEGRSVHTVTTYDNLDRVIKSQQFAVENHTMTLIAQTEQYYDSRGQVWKSEQSVANPESGNVRGKIATFNWFDDKGRQTQSQSTAENVHHVWQYDSLGRIVAQKSMLGNSTLQSTETVYDNSGNAVLTVESEKLADSNQMRSRYVAAWFDPVGRQLATADYGYVDGQCEPVRNYIPTSSETVLVTKTLYDPQSGKAIGSIDPAGRESRIETDALGRVVRSIANLVPEGTAADENVTVETAYTPDGQVATLTAVNSATGNQTTTYIYDCLGRLQREIYPDAENSPENSVDDSVEYSYNRQNEVVSKRDQNGTVHDYQYDNLGRLLADNVQTLGNGVDGTVRKIERKYNKIGALETLISEKVDDSVLNEVRFEYAPNRKLKRMYQSHEGQVDSATPFVEYNYDNDGRLIDMTYPSGKRLTYEYNFAGHVTAIRNGEGMVQVLENECSSSGSGSGWNPQPTGNEIVRYVRDGAGRFMQTTYVEPDLTLDYTGGLDRFGRIVDHAWTNGNGDNVVRIQHNYDMSGNRLNRIDSVNPLNSEAYSYDSMGQIKSLTRNDFAEAWTFDATGNWVQYDKNGLVENRSHNKANEILTGIIHDANGNMTQIPSPKGDGNLNCVYDAWNRLIKINDNICYEYNGLNHRVKKTVDNVVTKSFFNEKWQELERFKEPDAQQSGASGLNSTIYVWGLRYVDDLIYRDKNEERLYSLADPNWNVIATTDETGEAQELFVYNAFGKVNGLTSDWNRAFTGQVLDQETGLMLYRMRFYHPDMGRFVSRDPISYDKYEINLYRHAHNASTAKKDPFGLTETLDEAIAENCCKTAKVIAKSRGTIGGTTICCNCEVLTCNFSEDLFQYLDSGIAKQIMKDCTDVHENTHAGHVSCDGKHVDQTPTLSKGMDHAGTECLANIAELNCYKSKIGLCGGNQKCIDDITFLIEETIDTMSDTCKKTNPNNPWVYPTDETDGFPA